VIVQLPVPKHISENKIIEAIDPKKDVDGFHPINLGRMVIGLPAYVSATPAGVVELLKRYKIETAGKACGCYRQKQHCRQATEYSSCTKS
jgi:methylenetetrahydrofolate dehydrogenase (NADP+)/methenyltetrahydrofolate cyclohydrolase